MADSTKDAKRGCRLRLARWIAAFAVAAAFSWAAAWFYQRSLNSHSRQRQLQSWLDGMLNADVSLMRDARVRVNLVRDARLHISDLEIEHPNVIFPGKFIVGNRVVASCSPFSLLGLWADRLDVAAEGMRIRVEENEFGEWSTAGLLNPIAPMNIAFPYPEPKLSGWKARFSGSGLSVRRGDIVLDLGLDVDIEGIGGGRLALHSERIPFSLTRAGVAGGSTGVISAQTAIARIAYDGSGSPALTPEDCEFRIENLPVSSLAFFTNSPLLEFIPGSFFGMVRVEAGADGQATLQCEGEIRDAPLSVFGLPRTTPIRGLWPFGAPRDGLAATIRLGPSGFGGFDITMPLGPDGMPTKLGMRGDVAALGDVPRLFEAHARWPERLSRLFDTVEWEADKWLGFGWSGDRLGVVLSRSTAGLNLFGEADLLGGKVRVAMNPGQDDHRVSVAAEKLDARLLAAKLSPYLPDPWKASLSGTHANLAWRGNLPESGAEEDWDTSIVFGKPVIDGDGHGEWWRRFFDLPRLLIASLDDWGGGDPTPLAALAEKRGIAMDQLSVVCGKNVETGFRSEFLAHGGDFGEIGGWAEVRADGAIRGGLALVGKSNLLAAVAAANPGFGRILELLASTPSGLQIDFGFSEAGGVFFTPVFLDDARRLQSDLENAGEG